uniref:Uncharacterized protein n=1 Tax=Panagrolaimus sp. PS1159 TaxID=55785 RepID=A0AC35FGC3_9BILA
MLSNNLKLANSTIAETEKYKQELEKEVKDKKLKEEHLKVGYEELNEIVLGEFRLLEQARNSLIYNFSTSMLPSAANIPRELLTPSEKSKDFGRQLDKAVNRKR